MLLSMISEDRVSETASREQKPQQSTQTQSLRKWWQTTIVKEVITYEKMLYKLRGIVQTLLFTGATMTGL